MNTKLIEEIWKLAGDLRAPTFCDAAVWILVHKPGLIIETGCFRGSTCDGNSTLILANLAREIGATFKSIDIDPNHLEAAEAHIKENGLQGHATFIEADSINWLRNNRDPIGFAYYDSFDHDPNNPGPCQIHQLREVESGLECMTRVCAILMDDNVPGTGGKTRLSSVFLEACGWTKASTGYQLLYTREQ